MTLWPLHAHAKGRDDISTSNGQPATQEVGQGFTGNA